MGNSAFSPTDWDKHSSATRGKSTASIFTSHTAKSTNDPRTSFDPKTIPFRESRDSVTNPNSTPIIICLDVTGSMHEIPGHMIRDGLGPLFGEIYDRKPVEDPHILFAAVGDANTDQWPLQVTQFEADIVLASQLKDIYLEGNGGGNGSESYNLPWFWAINRTKCDRIEKNRGKGILFTIGDEELPKKLLAAHVKEFLGDDVDEDMDTKALYDKASQTWDIFHLVVAEGGHYRGAPDRTLKSWRDILGERAILLTDYKKTAQVIVSVLQVLGGEDKDKVAASWDGDTSIVVRSAIDTLTVGGGSRSLTGKKGLVTL